MRISEKQVGSAVVLELAGHLTKGRGAVAVEAAVRRHMTLGTRTMVANFARVRSLDAAGAQALVEAYTPMRAAGSEMRLAGLSRVVREQAANTDLLTTFSAFDSVQQAVHGAILPAFTEPPGPRWCLLTCGILQRLLGRA
jgi:anti-anti-sigma factor